MRVLLVEDDAEVSVYIKNSLEAQGYKVDACYDGQDGLAKAQQESYSILIIDRMLPGLDGLTLIKNLRAAENKTPVLILSALGEIDDRVKGLRSGGDDYLVKPFAFEELLARIEVLARRAGDFSGQETKLAAGSLEMDLISRKVTRGGQNIELQSREFRLLEYLLRNKGRIVTRAMLLENVWDYHFDPQTNVIDVHISRLRGKIDKGAENPTIKTVRGAGYVIED